MKKKTQAGLLTQALTLVTLMGGPALVGKTAVAAEGVSARMEKVLDTSEGKDLQRQLETLKKSAENPKMSPKARREIEKTIREIEAVLNEPAVAKPASPAVAPSPAVKNFDDPFVGLSRVQETQDRSLALWTAIATFLLTVLAAVAIARNAAAKKRAEIARLDAEVKGLKKLAEDNEAKIKAVDASLVAKQTELDRAKQALADVEDALNGNYGGLDPESLAGKAHDLRAEKDDLETATADLNEQLRVAQEDVALKAANVKSLEEQKELLDKNNQDLRDAIVPKEQRIQELERSAREAEARAAAAEGLAAEARTAADGLTAERDRLKDAVENNQASQEALDRAGTAEGLLKEVRSALDGANEAHTAQLVEKDADHNRALEELRDLHDNALTLFADQLSGLTKRLGEATEARDAGADALNHAHAERDRLSKELVDTKEAAEKAAEEAKKAAQEAQKNFDAEIARIKNVAEADVAAERKTAQDWHDKLVEVNKTLKIQLDEKRAELDLTKRGLQEKGKEIERLKTESADKLEDRDAEIAELVRSVDFLQERAEELKTQVEDIESTLASVRTESAQWQKRAEANPTERFVEILKILQSRDSGKDEEMRASIMGVVESLASDLAALKEKAQGVDLARLQEHDAQIAGLRKSIKLGGIDEVAETLGNLGKIQGEIREQMRLLNERQKKAEAEQKAALEAMRKEVAAAAEVAAQKAVSDAGSHIAAQTLEHVTTRIGNDLAAHREAGREAGRQEGMNEVVEQLDQQLAELQIKMRNPDLGDDMCRELAAIYANSGFVIRPGDKDQPVFIDLTDIGPADPTVIAKVQEDIRQLTERVDRATEASRRRRETEQGLASGSAAPVPAPLPGGSAITPTFGHKNLPQVPAAPGTDVPDMDADYDPQETAGAAAPVVPQFLPPAETPAAEAAVTTPAAEAAVTTPAAEAVVTAPAELPAPAPAAPVELPAVADVVETPAEPPVPAVQEPAPQPVTEAPAAPALPPVVPQVVLPTPQMPVPHTDTVDVFRTPVPGTIPAPSAPTSVPSDHQASPSHSGETDFTPTPARQRPGVKPGLEKKGPDEQVELFTDWEAVKHAAERVGTNWKDSASVVAHYEVCFGSGSKHLPRLQNVASATLAHFEKNCRFRMVRDGFGFALSRDERGDFHALRFKTSGPAKEFEGVSTNAEPFGRPVEPDEATELLVKAVWAWFFAEKLPPGDLLARTNNRLVNLAMELDEAFKHEPERRRARELEFEKMKAMFAVLQAEMVGAKKDLASREKDVWAVKEMRNVFHDRDGALAVHNGHFVEVTASGSVIKVVFGTVIPKALVLEKRTDDGKFSVSFGTHHKNASEGARDIEKEPEAAYRYLAFALWHHCRKQGTKAEETYVAALKRIKSDLDLHATEGGVRLNKDGTRAIQVGADEGTSTVTSTFANPHISRTGLRALSEVRLPGETSLQPALVADKPAEAPAPTPYGTPREVNFMESSAVAGAGSTVLTALKPGASADLSNAYVTVSVTCTGYKEYSLAVGPNPAGNTLSVNEVKISEPKTPRTLPLAKLTCTDVMERIEAGILTEAVKGVAGIPKKGSEHFARQRTARLLSELANWLLAPEHKDRMDPAYRKGLELAKANLVMARNQSADAPKTKI